MKFMRHHVYGKTLSYWKELYFGPFLGFILAIVLINLEHSFSEWVTLIKEFPALGMCAFGFLLTFLSIILQGNNETIVWMKSRKILFEKFVSFNKRIVMLSLILTLYSYILCYAHFKWIIDLIMSCPPEFRHWLKVSLISIFGGLMIWFFIDTFTFINIFYHLIKKSK